MEAKDVIQLLRLQRHDLMNDLQIVHGYLSMGKTDKVKTKVNDIIETLNQERLLMNSNCPKFVLWLLQVNLHHKHVKFTYDIHTENKNLLPYDEVLTDIGNTIIDYILDSKLETITGEIQVFGSNNSIDLIMKVTDQSIDFHAWKDHLAEKLDNVVIQAEESESEIKFIFSISSTD